MNGVSKEMRRFDYFDFIDFISKFYKLSFYKLGELDDLFGVKFWTLDFYLFFNYNAILMSKLSDVFIYDLKGIENNYDFIDSLLN